MDTTKHPDPVNSLKRCGMHEIVLTRLKSQVNQRFVARFVKPRGLIALPFADIERLRPAFPILRDRGRGEEQHSILCI